MHCNLRPPDAAQSLSAFISLPVLGFKFELVQPILVVIVRYVTLCPWMWPGDLDLWPLTLNMCSRPASPQSKSVRNLSEIEQSTAELLRSEYVTLWPWTITCGIVCTKLKLSQAIRSWNVTIFHANTSRHAMTLTFDPLTLKLRGNLVSRGHSL